MATRLTAEEVLLELEGSDGEVSSEDEDDYEGEGIVGYLPEPASYFSEAFEDSREDDSDDEDDTAMDWEDIGLERDNEDSSGEFRQFSSVTILRSSVTVILEI